MNRTDIILILTTLLAAVQARWVLHSSSKYHGDHCKEHGFSSESCPQGCPRIFNPVCAHDSESRAFRFFHNDCLMRADRCETQKDWYPTHMSLCLHVVEPELLQDCLRPCLYEFKPVCGLNGKKTEIFSNECIFDMENCFANGRWTKVQDDDCVF